MQYIKLEIIIRWKTSEPKLRDQNNVFFFIILNSWDFCGAVFVFWQAAWRNDVHQFDGKVAFVSVATVLDATRPFRMLEAMSIKNKNHLRMLMLLEL